MREAAIIKSPLGPIVIAATERGISEVRIRPGAADLAELRRERRRRPASPARIILRRMQGQLDRYFRKCEVEFSVPLDLSAGTEFQRRVWRACMRIPRGQVRSYGELAAMAGCPRGARAAGGAMAANPLSIVVPCHRVISSDGSLGGYGPGADLKEFLLRLEGVEKPALFCKGRRTT